MRLASKPRWRCRARRFVAVEAAMAPPAKRPAKTREAAGSTLAQRIVAAPILSSPRETRAKVSTWLAEMADDETGRTLKRLPSASKHLQALIEGIADGSPYLWELASSE